ncbi:hypothetical protein FBUS_00817 [Fasciolopsis buskii]|uniref:Uncharacterized protein n=1 Tax=Fasciolopsis buskii TaxID=27845 RepID=A0A8E0RWP8_9TREM|nr:hypothetical protein FBUS_00817 [Fasciolopsis buski]
MTHLVQARPCEGTGSDSGMLSPICGSVLGIEASNTVTMTAAATSVETADAGENCSAQTVTDEQFGRDLLKKRRLTSTANNIPGTRIKKGRLAQTDGVWNLDTADSPGDVESSGTQQTDQSTSCWSSTEHSSTVASVSTPSTGSPISAHSQVSPESTTSTLVDTHGTVQPNMPEMKTKSAAFSIESIMGKRLEETSDIHEPRGKWLCSIGSFSLVSHNFVITLLLVILMFTFPD